VVQHALDHVGVHSGTGYAGGRGSAEVMECPVVLFGEPIKFALTL
jgi:hypothetical protein